MLFEALDLTLKPGQAALISGPNGSGKSSLLRLVAGLIVPMCGQVVCQGKIALADENHALDPETSLEKALSFWASIDGTLPEQFEAALSRMGVLHLGGIPVRLFSTGQRKRAAIARVIASGAEIWLLDEPANGLDAAGVALLENAIAAHRAQGGIVLVTSHQPLDVPDALPIRLGAA